MALTQEERDFALAQQFQGEDVNEDNLFDVSDDDVLYSALDSITDDYMYALQLQEELNKLSALSPPVPPSSRPKTYQKPTTKTSIVDESWEYVDPTPDIFALFKQFNQTYFWGKLDGVEVRWSPRMTLCAGVCSYEGRGGLCSVRLSLPLLKLRPRKDLVQTLLHEMIHAYLFVTQNNKDHDAHGPEFCKHMDRLNKETGAKITVYHTFHDEVELYRQHWWKCNGPCQKRPPYYGILRRATNRAPGPNDPWWNDHEKLCGGSYIKFKEPEGYKDPKKRKKDDPGLVGSKSPSPKKPKGPTQQLITPFSGKGYVLGSTNSGKPDRANPLFDRPASASGTTHPIRSPAGQTTTRPTSFPRDHVRSNIATLPLVPNSPQNLSNNKGNSNVVTFGSRQPLTSNQATRLKSNSSSTVTITQRKPAATTTSPRSTPSASKAAKPKTKSPITKQKGSPSKLQTLRDMFSKMQNSPPKKWSNGKVRGSTAIRHESSSSDEKMGESSSKSRTSDNRGAGNEVSRNVNGATSGKNRQTTPTGNNSSLKVGNIVGVLPRGSPVNPRNWERMQKFEQDKGEDKARSKPNISANQNVSGASAISLCECPVCHRSIAQSDINQHLDVCLTV